MPNSVMEKSSKNRKLYGKKNNWIIMIFVIQ